MKRKGPTLAEFDRISDALRNKTDLGNALQDGLNETLWKDLDSTEVEKALLYLDMKELMPQLVMWRRRFIEQALKELDAPLTLEKITIRPRLIGEEQ